MMFHHKQAEHVSVGLFKDHEGQPLVTVDGINAGTVDYLEEMIRNFRRQQAEALADPNQVKAPFVVKDGVLYLDKIDISNAYISTLIVRDGNIVSV
ncbi:hypothetical protein FLX27_21945 [Agrobacterium tumefaciens]|nr:hypothetical protein [Agrobacterium tumefaciens]TQN59577.1 hypothetical protein FLX27_21945 [Agrobacterium tumefaciens]